MSTDGPPLSSIPSSALPRSLRLPVVALALLATGCAASFPEGEPIDVLTTVLRGKGFEVREGAVRDFAIEDCVALPNCFGNNATSPYGLWLLPDEASAIPDSLPPDEEGRVAGWALREDEAVVYVGRTSPAARYFSYSPYIFSRADEAGVQQPVFASLTDSINNATLGDDPFDREIAIILTADGDLAARVRRTLERAGLPPESIHVMALDAELLRMEGTDDSDRIMMLQRFALFDSETEGRAYLDDTPARVVRITPERRREIAPMEIPSRSPRAEGESELDLEPAVDDLEAGIRAAYASATISDVSIVSASLVDLVLRPEACIANLTNCLGEIRDTTYSAGPIAMDGVGIGVPVYLGDAPGERFVAYGVNHEATGRATYSNMVVTHTERLAGVAALDSRSMPGSTAPYLTDHPEAPNLFAFSIMRDCGAEPHCVEVPTGFPGVNADEPISFQFRAYLQPGATVSAHPRGLVAERVLHIVP